MAKTKISVIARNLNVGLNTVTDFLRKKNIEVEDNNPNFRVEDDVTELLVKEFGGGGKNISFHKPAAASKTSAPAAAKTPATADSKETSGGIKILGKIDLNSNTPTVKPVATPADEVKPEPKPEVKPEPKPEVKPEPKPEVKPEPKPEVKPEPKPEVKPEPTVAEPQAETKPTEPEVFRLHTADELQVRAPQLNVVGKIDLSAINQSTRPKKKQKEDRRKAKPGTPGAAGTQSSANAGDRKKRKRISGEKIDVEKAGKQAGQGGNRNNDGKKQRSEANKNNQHNHNNGDRNNNRRPVHNEVNEEDVQKQVKEVLARLTAKGNKGQKTGAKWRKEKREAFANREHERAEMEEAESRVLKLTEFVTANDLASMMNVPVNNVIATCMSMGVMVSINQRLDAETINIVAEEFGFRTEYISAEVSEAIAQEADSEEDLETRPPIVTVMGHVDHGKTSLLDYIRQANVIAGEAGGITQHIGAYNVKLADGRHITFLDTPGHEAFTAMRARGAKVTDLCIIIVAADDAVMPQTVEAINHASAAGVPIVFAINKIDKPHANPDKIKEELASMNYLIEDWGGKYQSQDISAKKGLGVEDLMEKVLLEAEMLDLKANPNRRAVGSIIESSLDKGRGYVATVLVQNGTLNVGDIILAGTHYGKVKAMFNERSHSRAHPRTQRRPHCRRYLQRDGIRAGSTRNSHQARAAPARTLRTHQENDHTGRHWPPPCHRQLPGTQHHRQGRRRRFHRSTLGLAAETLH